MLCRPLPKPWQAVSLSPLLSVFSEDDSAKGETGKDSEQREKQRATVCERERERQNFFRITNNCDLAYIVAMNCMCVCKLHLKI